MIRPTEQKNVELGGAVLDEAKYHIDPSALPNITSILRGLYSDPIKAVLREYITNAVDAHTEAGIPEKEIEIKLPTAMDPLFTVRDFGLGLTIDQTKKLLYGYGASGELKRESNTQIGGFGIGCKCAFSVAESFTYTIWNGGRKRVWSCYLDESDTGMSKLVYDEPDDAPTGVLISIAIKLEYNGEHGIQKSINELLRFLPGTFKLIDSTRYTLPVQPVPVLEQDAQCVVNGKSSSITYQFFQKGKIEDMPAIVVGGTSYTIADAQVDEAMRDLPGVTPPDLATARGLLKQLAIQCPIGFLQIAPSREELQYSGLTKKVLRTLLGTLASAEFIKKLCDRVKDKLGTSTVISRRQQADLLGLKLNENQSDDTGLYFTADLAEGLDNIAVYGLRYHRGYASLYGNSQIKDSEWGDSKVKVVALNANLVEKKSDTYDIAVISVDHKTTSIEQHDLALRLATKLVKQGDNDGTLDSVYIAIITNPKVDKIEWLKDKSVACYTEADLPAAVDKTLLRSNVTAPTPPPVVAKPKRVSLATKFLKFNPKGDTPNASSENAAFWGTSPVKTTKNGVYVVIDHYCIDLSTNQKNEWAAQLHPKDITTFLSSIEDQGITVLPELNNGLLGVRRANVSPELKSATEYVTLWDYMRNRLRDDVVAKKVDVEKLLTWMAISDTHAYDPSYLFGAFQRFTAAMKPSKIFGKNKTLKALVDIGSELPENKDTSTTAQWFRLLRLVEDKLVSLPTNTHGWQLQSLFNCAKLGYLSGNNAGSPMFELPATTGPMATWFASEDRVEYRGWLRVTHMCGRLLSDGSALVPNPLEAKFVAACTNFPLLMSIHDIRQLWTEFELPRGISGGKTPTIADKKVEELIRGSEGNLLSQVKSLLCTDAKFQSYLVSQAK